MKEMISKLLENRKTFLMISMIAIAAIFIWGRNKYLNPDVSKGQLAPDFSFTDLNGHAKKLSDSKGKWRLIHFWGSWCGPCRQENPHIKALKHKQSERNFEIISIGIESSQMAWRRALENDGLDWPNHFTSLKMFDCPIALLYGIRSIPSTILVDREGNIRRLNASPEEYEKMMD